MKQDAKDEVDNSNSTKDDSLIKKEIKEEKEELQDAADKKKADK